MKGRKYEKDLKLLTPEIEKRAYARLRCDQFDESYYGRINQMRQEGAFLVNSYVLFVPLCGKWLCTKSTSTEKIFRAKAQRRKALPRF
jgi:hypothetical protein